MLLWGKWSLVLNLSNVVNNVRDCPAMICDRRDTSMMIVVDVCAAGSSVDVRIKGGSDRWILESGSVWLRREEGDRSVVGQRERAWACGRWWEDSDRMSRALVRLFPHPWRVRKVWPRSKEHEHGVGSRAVFAQSIRCFEKLCCRSSRFIDPDVRAHGGKGPDPRYVQLGAPLFCRNCRRIRQKITEKKSFI